MIPFILPLTVTKGITFGPVTFNFKQADATPFDLTGYQVLAYARRYPNSKEKIDLAPQITDAANGTAVISFTDEFTLALTGGGYGWDLILEGPSGIRTGPYFAGPFKIKELYTHA